MENLSSEQRQLIEDKRQQAIAKRNATRTAQLIRSTVRLQSPSQLVAGSKLGDGFFNSGVSAAPTKLREARTDPVKCTDCQKLFFESVTLETFNIEVCDECRRANDRYRFVPRTEAKTLFKLKDCDLDSRPPPLLFLVKPNPHRENGAPMRLYLFSQLEERARVVWGSLEALEEERNKRKADMKKRRKNGFEKKIKDMRREMRAQSYQFPSGHEHNYGPEQADPDHEDGFFKECLTCEHRLTYEKM